MMKRRQTYRQKGVAAILFVLMIPPLFGLFFLGTDGALMLQNDARLNDALEAASLAVAAANDDNDDDGDGIDDGSDTEGGGYTVSDDGSFIGSGSSFNQALATAYIKEYVKDMNSITSISISKLKCEEIPECVTGLANGDPRFFEYNVTASTDHDRMLYDNSDSYQISSDGSARKFQNQAVDIVFVSDFSGSMDETWGGGVQEKYLDLVDVIEDVTDELAKYNGLVNHDDSTVGYVGFNWYVHTLVSETEITYVKKGKIKTKTEVEYCVYDHVISGSASGTVASIFPRYDSSGNLITDSTDVCTSKTITLNKFNSSDNDDAYFYDLDLTSDFDAFNNTIADFYPDHGTSSYQGLIRGAQIAYDGDNPRRLIIILSDGDDNSTSTTQSLVNAGMCSTITNTLDGLTTTGGDDVESKIAVIGFDYDVDDNQALQDCAGNDNVFEAESMDDVLNQILELITEEIGHLN